MTATARSIGPIHFDPAREEAELRDYLGDRFELDRLYRYQDQLDAEFAATDDEQRFYRTSEGYLYNLTAFAMTGTKLPYLKALLAHVPSGARILDYGCGLGSDGLLLLDAGFRVEFADFANPSTEYLRWRLQQRGDGAPIHDLDVGVPDGYDAAFAFDVIEHVDDPVAFLREMEQRARLVEVNFLEPEPDDQDLHHELDVRALVAHASRQRLLHYRVYHGRSHLVVYGTRPATGMHRVRSLAQLATGRLSAAARR
jgi:SAM-dependent methyltransferase